MNLQTNLILIGMPGSGKSTIGRLLAQKLGWPFIDTDNVIKEQQQRALQDILDTEGIGGFIRKEAQAVMSLQLEHHVVATGGSVVLDRQAMNHLQAIGRIVYLEVPLPKIEPAALEYQDPRHCHQEEPVNPRYLSYPQTAL